MHIERALDGIAPGVHLAIENSAGAGARGKLAILETPGEEEDDARNVAALRTVLEGVAA